MIRPYLFPDAAPWQVVHVVVCSVIPATISFFFLLLVLCTYTHEHYASFIMTPFFYHYPPNSPSYPSAPLLLASAALPSSTAPLNPPLVPHQLPPSLAQWYNSTAA